MQTKDNQASEERRAYYRLLRHLVSDELQAFYNRDQAQASQNKDFPEFAHYELPRIH